MRKLIVSFALVLMWGGPVWAGPVILAGHDADDHGFQSVYAGLFDNLASNVTNAGSGILAIGADPSSTAASWITGVAGLMATTPAVTFVNDAAITAQSFAGFAILHVPSDIFDTSGGITEAENNLLAARASAVAAFVNGGGGLFGLTQDDANITQQYGYITGTGGLGAITTLTAPPSGVLPSGGLYDNVTPTAAGSLLGITNTNIDGCCWHNVFTAFPGFLSVLATANEPNVGDEAFNNQAAVIGGATVVITPVPEPSTLLFLGSGLAGLGALIARRQYRR